MTANSLDSFVASLNTSTPKLSPVRLTDSCLRGCYRNIPFALTGRIVSAIDAWLPIACDLECSPPDSEISFRCEPLVWDCHSRTYIHPE